MSTETDTSRTHVYTGSGCIHQWVTDHNTKDCIATFKAENNR